MISLSRISNAAASVHKLLSYSGMTMDINAISGELEKHPDYPSLLAVSDVLSSMKVENAAFRLSYDELLDLPCPFLAYMQSNGGELLVISKIKAAYFLVSNEKWDNHKLSREAFKNAYAEIVLTADVQTSAQSATPPAIDVTAKRFYLTAFMAVVLLATLIIQNRDFTVFDWRFMLLAIFKTAALITAVLLLVQSIDSNNPLVQKLCTGGEKTNCNAILHSKAARITDGLSWSEVGFYYFAGTWTMLLFGSTSPQSMLLLALLNVLCLPYTFYSVYYQGLVAKQWCILCCTVQALLWLEFIPLSTYIHIHYFQSTTGWGDALRTLAVCLLIPLVLWRLLKPVFLKSQQVQPLKDQLRKFKYNADIFNQLLAVQPRHTQPDEDWSIVIGNSMAPHVVTLVTNPYCPPCAQAHQLLHELINSNENIQGRIIFTAQNKDSDILTPVTRHIMALNALPDKEIGKKALEDWYQQKQKDYTSWAKAYPVELKEAEFYKLDKQHAWCQTAEIYATPTLLINGHRLPEMYYLPDLKYMLQ